MKKEPRVKDANEKGRDNPLVSIIVPSYNAESYIEDCVNSVIKQTYTQWELLLVDDGSTDQTPDIIDQFSNSDPRIIGLHQIHGGVSTARNKGLERAKGDYIVFLDADDMLTPNSLAIRVEGIQDADMVIGRISFVNESVTPIGTTSICPSKTWTGEEILKNIVVSGEAGYQGYSVNKIFRRKQIEEYKIRFAEDVAYNEDRLFCAKYVLHCKKVRHIDEIIYLYRQILTGTTGSLNRMTDKDKEKIMTEFLAYDMLMDLLKENHRNCYYLTSADAQNRAVYLKRLAPQDGKELKQGFRAAIRKYGIISMKAPLETFPFKRRIKIFAHMILGL